MHGTAIVLYQRLAHIVDGLGAVSGSSCFFFPKHQRTQQSSCQQFMSCHRMWSIVSWRIVGRVVTLTCIEYRKLSQNNGKLLNVGPSAMICWMIMNRIEIWRKHWTWYQINGQTGAPRCPVLHYFPLFRFVIQNFTKLCKFVWQTR